MKGKWFGYVAIVALVVSACGNDAGEDTVPPGNDVVLRVVANDSVAADWTLEALEAQVPFSTLTIDGDDQTGPLLVDVLSASGIEAWTDGTVIGYGEGRTFETSLDITAAEVTERWILDVTNKGTLKLAAEDLPREQWVRDVGEITVR